MEGDRGKKRREENDGKAKRREMKKRLSKRCSDEDKGVETR